MKKALYLSGIAALSFFMGSCSLDTENPSAMEGEVIYSATILANSSVVGIHQSFGETNSYRGRYIPYFGINSDCEVFNNYGGVADPATDKEASLACYSASSSNTYMNTANNAWAKMYEAIERANKGLADMDKYAKKDSEGNISDRDMKHLYGELLTLRAMIYFDLVKSWGDVPYRFSPVDAKTMYLPTTDRVTVLKKLLSDLEAAETMVYGPKDKTLDATIFKMSTERVSTVFARGLRARIALFLAGKSEWPNEGLRYNIQDENERKALYQIALDECEAVIDKEGMLSLDKLPFEQNFKNLCQDITTPGLESIFEIPFSDGRGRVLYTWGGKHAIADQWTGLGKGGVNGPIPTLWYDYDPQDRRRDITVLPYAWVASDQAGVSIKGTSNLIAGGWSFGKLRFEWMNRHVTSTNDDGVNWQVMRLADVYLMAAEAANELGLPDKAKKHIRPVMERAYPVELVNSKLDAVSTKEAFFNLLVDERKFEFAGEAIRKVDLMRWGLLSEKMAEAKENLIAFANRDPEAGEGKYDKFPLKFYYKTGLGAEPTQADEYYIYGLNAGETDAEGKALKLDNSTFVFTLKADKDADKEKVKKYIDNFYLNDPNEKMFWPIWKVFIDSSNGMLKNNYGY